MNRQRRYGRTLPEALGEYTRRDPARFHMPGHKGQDIPYGNRLTGWDVTELDGTDNLANPAGVISVTEGAYRDAYGARASMLLVGGLHRRAAYHVPGSGQRTPGIVGAG